MRDLQKYVASWQEKTFGKNSRHLTGMMEHLKKEIEELETEVDLYESVHKSKSHLESELADCVILLLGIAHGAKIDLELAVQKKMSENLNRKWKKPDKHGVCEHEDD